MLEGDLDILMDLWALSMAKHDDLGPFDLYEQMYSAIDAMKHGDVGRILHLFLWWSAIFTAMGKHKYSAHMRKFKTNLDHVYPPRLR